MASILVIDDEPHILELAKLYLEQEGYRAHCIERGTEALRTLNEIRPDLIVLDLMLPDMDGFEVCRRIRKVTDIPVIMLTARKEDVDKIVGLELGADDYLTKPFNPRELIARIRAVLRRYQAGGQRGSTVKTGDLCIDPARREATVSGRQMTLRTKEFDLLLALANNAGIVLTRDRLLEMVWGMDFYGETRTVDIHINHLRDKLADAAVSIETIRGVGYKLTGRDNARE